AVAAVARSSSSAEEPGSTQGCCRWAMVIIENDFQFLVKHNRGPPGAGPGARVTRGRSPGELEDLADLRRVLDPPRVHAHRRIAERPLGDHRQVLAPDADRPQRAGLAERSDELGDQ